MPYHEGVDNQVVTCERCGAPIDVPKEGVSYGCKYCGAEVQVTVDAAQIAKGMKLDLSNATAFLARLAHTLETAVADRTKIQRLGSEVVTIELDLAPDLFIAKRESHTVLAQHKRLVRGIALKTATHPLDRWVEMVTTALAAHANENARTTAALS
jgi:predicted RNA-binding Zn-ribbon protein involved in translation (DUF1610 family)